jgi:hypothetical protein
MLGKAQRKSDPVLLHLPLSSHEASTKTKLSMEKVRLKYKRSAHRKIDKYADFGTGQYSTVHVTR